MIAVSVSGLLLTAGPAILVFMGALKWQEHALLMMLGTAAWFATAPFWMRSRSPQSTEAPKS